MGGERQGDDGDRLRLLGGLTGEERKTDVYFLCLALSLQRLVDRLNMHCFEVEFFLEDLTHLRVLDLRTQCLEADFDLLAPAFAL